MLASLNAWPVWVRSTAVRWPDRGRESPDCGYIFPPPFRPDLPNVGFQSIRRVFPVAFSELALHSRFIFYFLLLFSVSFICVSLFFPYYVWRDNCMITGVLFFIGSVVLREQGWAREPRWMDSFSLIFFFLSFFLFFFFVWFLSLFWLNADPESTVGEFTYSTIESYNLGSSHSDWSKTNLHNSMAPKSMRDFQFQLSQKDIYTAETISCSGDLNGDWRTRSHVFFSDVPQFDSPN